MLSKTSLDFLFCSVALSVLLLYHQVSVNSFTTEQEISLRVWSKRLAKIVQKYASSWTELCASALRLKAVLFWTMFVSQSLNRLDCTST